MRARVPFTVHVEGGESLFKFNQPKPQLGFVSDEEEEAQGRCRLTAWKGKKGSRYWEGLFGSFDMPGGNTLMHFHHRSEALASVHPGEEPADPEPIELRDIQQSALPAEVAPPRPDAKGQSKMRQFIYMSAPLPSRATLTAGDHEDVWFGTLPRDPGVDIFVEPSPPKKEDKGGVGGGGGAAPKAEKKGWEIENSLWKARKAANDSRLYLDSAEALQRGLGIDWTRCCSDRLIEAVLPYDPKQNAERAEHDLVSLRDVLDQSKGLLYAVFRHFPIQTAQSSKLAAGDDSLLTAWSSTVWSAFYDETQMAEPSSKNCRSSDLDSMFLVACNDAPPAAGARAKGGTPEPESEAAQPQTKLRRYGFLGLLMRVATVKFATEAELSPAWALARLLYEHLAQFTPPMARIVTNEFRAKKLYTQGAAGCFQKHHNSLKALFAHFAGSMMDPEAKPQNESMSLCEWMKLLQEGELHDAKFGRREAAYCFMWSQMFVADEQKRREKLLSLSFLDFLEALGRVTCFKALPTATQLIDTKCETVSDFMVHLQSEGAFNDFLDRNAPNWQSHQREGRVLEDVLDKLLLLLVSAFDSAKQGYVTPKDLANRAQKGRR